MQRYQKRTIHSSSFLYHTDKVGLLLDPAIPCVMIPQENQFMFSVDSKNINYHLPRILLHLSLNSFNILSSWIDGLKLVTVLWYVNKNLWHIFCFLKLLQLDGGPPLLYYHEMCVDPISRKLFVFGGLVLTPDPVPATYGGFYSFDLDQCKWKILR